MVAVFEDASSTLLTLGFGFTCIFDFRQTFAKRFVIPQYLHLFPRAGQFWLWLADQAYPQLGHIVRLKLIVVDLDLFQEFWTQLIEVFAI